MNYIILPHSGKAQINAGKFIATWKVWVETFYPVVSFETVCLPRRNAAQNFQQSIDQGLDSYLDVMCRLLAPSSYLDVMQATNVFMKVNAEWIAPCLACSKYGRKVAGAQLTKKSVKIYKNIKPQLRKTLERDAKILIKKTKKNQYTIETHHHRFAAWAAATAARASKLCRFSVKQGFQIIDSIGFGPDFSFPNNLPHPSRFDMIHGTWREKAIYEAKNLKINGFTHGVAAKLINCYLKARFVCGPNFNDLNTQLIHPPIDRVLLESLERIDFGGQKAKWKSLKTRGWSNFNSGEYQEAIQILKKSMGHKELWRIEEFWRGYQ
jgi:hypothetical protein